MDNKQTTGMDCMDIQMDMDSQLWNLFFDAAFITSCYYYYYYYVIIRRLKLETCFKCKNTTVI